MPYSPEKLRYRGDFYRANGRWPSTAEVHSAFDRDIPETSPDVPGNVPEASSEEQPGPFPSAKAPGSGERSPSSSKARWNIWTGFL